MPIIVYSDNTTESVSEIQKYPDKCKVIPNIENFVSIIEFDDLTQKWAEDNSSLIQSVSIEIINNIRNYNNIVDTYNFSGLVSASIKFSGNEIDSLSNPDTWDIGGSDDFGEFGESGELNREIKNKANSIIQYVRSGGITLDQSSDLISYLELGKIVGSSYDKIREAFKNAYLYEYCKVYLTLTIGPNSQYDDYRQIDFELGKPDIYDDTIINLKNRLTAIEQGNVELGTDRRQSGAITPLFGSLEFKEQCFLLSSLFNLSKIKEQFDHGVSGSAKISDEEKPLEKKLPYDSNSDNEKNNNTVLTNAYPFAFMNQLTQTPTKDAFFEMNNAQLSSLQPMIRLYKVIANEDSTPDCPSEKQIEIKFDPSATQHGINNLKIEDFLKDKNNRNPGVGLKSFNFTYDGYNPYAIKKSISAKLVIHANSFNELIKERKNYGDDDDDKYSYIELALKTGGENTIQYARPQNDVAIENLNKLNFRLKVVMGWQNPMFTNRGIFTRDVLNGINNQSVTLNLTPTIHDFAFDDIGRVTFTINYLAYIEDYYDNPSFNIFSEKEVFFEMVTTELEYKKLNTDCNKEELNRRKEDDLEESVIKERKQKLLRHLMTTLLNKRKIYSINIKDEEIPIFGNGGPYGRAAALYSTEDLLNKIGRLGGGTVGSGTAVADIANISIDNQPESDNQTQENLKNFILFFFAGDLVDIILENIGETLEHIKAELENLSPSSPPPNIDQQDLDAEIQKYKRYIDNFKRLRILLGPLEVLKPASYDTSVINLGDIPISFKHFLEWLTTTLLDKEIETFTLPSFLNSFFNKYIIDYLNQDICYGGKAKQRIILNQNALTEHRDNSNEPDSITKWCNTPDGIGGNPDDRKRSIKCPGEFIVDVRGVPITLGTERKCTRRLYIPQNLSESQYPILQVMGIRDDPRADTGVCNEINYLAYYAGRTIPVGEMKGIKADDHQKGIWHYQIGKDRGIVKSINLQKTDTPGLAEVRFEQDGYDGLRQLRVVYDVTIKTYLDVSLFPGTYIYVEPKGFDPSATTADGFDLTELGIGGYCMVWKSEHSIVAGQPESTLYAKWVASRDANVVQPLEEGQDPAPTKCAEIDTE